MFYLLPLLFLSVILKTSKSLNLPTSLVIPLPRLFDLPFTYDENFIPDYQELFHPLRPRTPHSDVFVQIPSQLEVSIKGLPASRLGDSIVRFLSRFPSYSRTRSPSQSVLDIDDVTRGSPGLAANAEDSIRRFSQSENSEDANGIPPGQKENVGYPLRRAPSLLDLSRDSFTINPLEEVDSTGETLSQPSYSLPTLPSQSEYEDKTLHFYGELNRDFQSRSVHPEYFTKGSPTLLAHLIDLNGVSKSQSELNAEVLTRKTPSQSSDLFSFDPSVDSTRRAPSLTDKVKYSIRRSDSSNLPSASLSEDVIRMSVSQSLTKTDDLTRGYPSQSYDTLFFHSSSQSSDSVHPFPSQSPDSLLPPPAQYEDAESSNKKIEPRSSGSAFIHSFVSSLRESFESVNALLTDPPPSQLEYQDKPLQYYDTRQYDTRQVGEEMRFLDRMPYYINSTRNFDTIPSEEDDLISMPSQTEDSFNINRVRNIWSALKCLQSNSLPPSYISEPQLCETGLNSMQY
uniref:Uncharacterized protein n=1 Tax=Cacopsylla melanoneura TaxID=428564 RepID=A0A8D9AXX1_9HEMI